MRFQPNLQLKAERRSDMMKTYQDKNLGFAIDIPGQWPYPIRVAPDNLLFDRSPIEVFNFVVGPCLPERLLEYTEFEFRQYVQKQGYFDLEFGRILVGGKDHVYTRYKMGNGVWIKKYMIVFAGIEYAITASCNNQQTFIERENTWDAVVKSFRLSKSREHDNATIKAQRSNIAGELYQSAYEAAAQGRYPEACTLLEKCLSDNPDHILAHKELAFVLKNTGKVSGALSHRLTVKRLDPSDTVNRYNLANLYSLLGAKQDALREIAELLVMEPHNPMFVELRKNLIRFPLTYEYYDEESRQNLGKKCNLKLINSIIPDFPQFTHLLLLYQWEEDLPDEEGRNLALRAIAFISCAIYEAAITAGLSCRRATESNGRRPAWIFEGEKSPVSLILSDINESERTCHMTIGAMIMSLREPPGDKTPWKKLHTAFKAQFSNICV
jgi:tetratricopeptide (TPR) repeat protein